MSSQSPSAKSSETTVLREMDFPNALRAVMVGNKVTKADWKDEGVFLELKDDHLKIHINGKYRDLIVSEGDLFGEDWYVL